MVKGGADNRSFRLQRRKKRPKKFHGRRTVGQPVYGEADKIGEFPGASEHSVVSETPEIGAFPLDNDIINDFTILEDTVVVDNSKTTASQRKINPILPGTSSNKLSGYRLIDMDIFNLLLANVACPCCGTIGLILDEKLKYGLAFKLNICCSSVSCDWVYECWTSKERKTSSNRKGYDINARSIYAMRRCGKGYQGLRRFLMLMNHPPPMSEKNYRKLCLTFSEAVRLVAAKSMLEAAVEIHDSVSTVKEDIVDTAASFDGAWQRRGYCSLNGVVAAKLLDVASFSKYCQGCISMEKFKTTDPGKYEIWKVSHVCSINHIGSAAAMEVAGVKAIFKRSVKNNQLRYTEYFGDGDSKSFSAVQNIYDGVTIVKRECIGHIQKRVGNRCRKLKKRVKGLGGKGKLTDSVIDKLQNYYGIAVRNNSGDLQKMKPSIAAALFHVASSADHVWHDHCPIGKDSWCQYNADMANGTSIYKPGAGLPKVVVFHVKPIFMELSADSLLEKCLHGKTQNQNESFNSMVWHRVPKDVRVNASTFEFGVYDAVAHFNLGNMATLNISDELGMEKGFYTTSGCQKENVTRIRNSVRKGSDLYIKRRQLLRGQRKRKGDKNKEAEGVTYKAGGF